MVFESRRRGEGNQTGHVADRTEAESESGVASDSQVQAEGIFLPLGYLTSETARVVRTAGGIPVDLRSTDFIYSH